VSVHIQYKCYTMFKHIHNMLSFCVKYYSFMLSFTLKWHTMRTCYKNKKDRQNIPEMTYRPFSTLFPTLYKLQLCK